MASDTERPEPDTTAVFTDTSVLFDYGIDDEEPARVLFVEKRAVGKVTSKRGKNEFDSVCSNREEIHRTLQSYIPGDLEAFDPDSLDHLTDNDLGYLFDLFSELLDTEDDREALRRLNEEKRKLKTAQRELFSDRDAFVEVIEVGPIDIQLRDHLATEIDNMDDVRLLCDAVEWSRNGGTGTFLTSDKDDFQDTEDESTSENTANDESDGLSETLEGFTDGDDRTRLERINDHISNRYSEHATVVIQSTESFLEYL